MSDQNMKQGVLFAEPRFRRVCRDVLLPAGLYSPNTLIVEAIVGLAPSDKAVYRAALHHLRGAATSVAVGLDRLAAMTAMSRRSATDGVARLHAAVLIDAARYRPGGMWRIAFAPLDWWLREHSRRVDPGLINRLLGTYTGESAIAQFVESAVAPTPAPADTAPTEAPPAAPAPAQAAAPEQKQEIFSTPVENSAPPHADFSKIVENSAPKTNTKTLNKTSAARAALRSISDSQNDSATAPQIRLIPACDTAMAWEDLLKLSARTRTDQQEEDDFQELLDVAKDVMGGNLGPVEAAKDVLYTLAHQIGRRSKPARTPLGLFLADGVRPLRIKAMRCAAASKKGAENG